MSDDKAPSAAELAKMRKEAEAEGKARAADPHELCDITGLKYVKATGLVPVKFKDDIPELRGNAGEILGLEPAQAKHVVNKGHASLVLE
jgi:hypothetical protein